MEKRYSHNNLYEIRAHRVISFQLTRVSTAPMPNQRKYLAFKSYLRTLKFRWLRFKNSFLLIEKHRAVLTRIVLVPPDHKRLEEK